ncbi:NB-ARC and TPR domain protein [Talaromyces stipitatus ATCC 10500]|uniref:NB-ARC and TPR domain protein n=1 Tax=Talaromyces stipitatus (strain ATCC 10500 / CBS 375.48 / QM 6759 / NRRL 1006) TaxID=441959 RepID=B8ME85_TALSN|nr:NB-ARC and TPR domain protein [Talaromyces stipitatus ATCC 10500]EED16512.1 NB-ARC and TPR domain protein [Talaromyces stipitatus ATCC 10500]
MNLLHQQATDFRPLWRSIAGAIFLGTPHTQSNDPINWQNAGAILRLHSKSKNARIPPTAEIAKRLAKISLSFEQAFDLIPVLSAYETKQTRIGGFLSSKAVLVGPEFAKTNVRYETPVPIDADHDKISCLKIGSTELNSICKFLDETIRQALVRIRRPSDDYVIPAALDQKTVADDEPNELEAVSYASEISKDATHGSTSLGFDIIPLVSDFSVERNDPLLPCYIMPPHPRNRAFFGRTEVLREIRERLLPKKSDKDGIEVDDDGYEIEPTPAMFALCGPGGIGKTQVATEFAHTSKDCYDAIFWLQADEYSKLSQGYTDIAIKLGLVLEDSVDARDPVVVQELVKGWLVNPLKTYKQQEDHQFAGESALARWLLVFDNVDDPNILDDFWPLDYTGTGAVLITSRDPLAKRYIYSEDEPGIILPPFTVKEATDFLLKLTHRESESKNETDAGTAVAERLGGLPLALTQMAGVIERRDLSFAEFLRIFNEEEDVRSKFFKMQIGNGSMRSSRYQHTLDTVWALEKLNKSSSILLDVLSVLDPDGIPEQILTGSMTELDEANITDEYPRTIEGYQDARTELLRSSLIARDRGANRITIHRLVQDGARAKMSDTRFEQVFALTSKLLYAAWPFEDFSFGHRINRWSKCAELFPHVVQLHGFSVRWKNMIADRRRVTETDVEFPKLLVDLGRFNHQRGNSSESTRYLETAMDIYKILQNRSETGPLNEDINNTIKRMVAEIHHDLGCIATETNQPNTALNHFIAFNKAMIEFADGEPQTKDMSLGVSWNELGNAYMMNGEWNSAADCFLRSMETLKQLENFRKVDLSFPQINLGFSYWLQGRLNEADEILSDILAAREEAYGINDRESFMTGKLLHAYGNVKASQGKLTESFEYHIRGLQQYKSTIGGNHHRTADLCVKVSDHYGRLGQYDTAMSLLDQALKIYGEREYYGPEKARALCKKGKLLAVVDKLEESRAYMSQAQVLYRKLKSKEDTHDATDADFDDLIVFWSK